MGKHTCLEYLLNMSLHIQIWKTPILFFFHWYKKTILKVLHQYMKQIEEHLQPFSTYILQQPNLACLTLMCI